MIYVYYLTLLLFSLFVSKRKFGSYINIASIFTALWTFTGILSTFGFFTLRKPIWDVHLFAGLFILSVNITFLFGVKSRAKMVLSNTVQQQDKEVCNKASGAAIIQIISLILASSLLFRMFSLLLRGNSLSTVRDIFFSHEAFSSEIAEMFFKIAPVGLMQGLVVYYVYFAFNNRSPIHILYALINAVLITIMGGGRYAVLLLIYSLVITMIIYKGKHSVSAGLLKKKTTKYIIGGVVVILMVTVSRGQDFWKTFVTYFSGSFSFLDYILQSPEQFALNEHLYGYLFFGAIIEPVVLLLKVAGLTTIKVPQYHFNIYCQQFYRISDLSHQITINNNTTILYYLLRDFGIAGIAIGGMIFGFVIAKLYNRAIEGKEFSTLLLIYMSNVLFNTVMTYQFFGMYPFFIVLVLFWCSRKKKFILKARFG